MVQVLTGARNLKTLLLIQVSDSVSVETSQPYLPLTPLDWQAPYEQEGVHSNEGFSGKYIQLTDNVPAVVIPLENITVLLQFVYHATF